MRRAWSRSVFTKRPLSVGSTCRWTIGREKLSLLRGVPKLSLHVLNN